MLGQASCPCLSPEEVEWRVANVSFANIGGKPYSAFRAGSVYSSSYGVACGGHDFKLPPFCSPRWCAEPIFGECVPRWCAESWCWVDASQCNGVPKPSNSSYFAHGLVQLVYSYETCNSTNVFSAFYEAIVAPRPPPVMPYPFPAVPPSPPPQDLTGPIVGGVFGIAAFLLIVGIVITRSLFSDRSELFRLKVKIRI